MKFARIVFLVAGIYGLIVVAPQYFLEAKIGRDSPPAITHPEFFYGFVGVTVAWQILFLVLSRDPARYRPMMLVGIVEKIGFPIAIAVLYAQNRVAPTIVAAATIDLVLAVLFLISYLKTGERDRHS
jgi:hypothetical protein